MITIKTNIPSLNSQRNMTNANNSIRDNFAKLSSGSKLPSAKDGAAQLAISERLTAQLRSLNQAQRNTMDGVSLIQTAEGSTSSINDNLVRMKELALQAANGILSDSDRGSIMSEYNALRDEIDRTSQAAEFNGQKLLDGSVNLNLQIGTSADQNNQTTININALTTETLGDDNLVISDTNVSTVQGALNALSSLDGAMNQVSSLRAQLGAKQNTLTSTITNLAIERENIAAANSRIADVDVASESARLAQNQILNQAAASVHAQANHLPALALSLIG